MKHILRTPCPVTAMMTWCGRLATQCEKDAVVVVFLDDVDCPGCIATMKRDLSALARWAAGERRVELTRRV